MPDARPLASLLARARTAVGLPVPPPPELTEFTILDAAAGGHATFHAAADPTDESALRTFEIEAYTGGPLDLYPYSLPVVVDLSELTAAKGSRPILRDHRPDRIVGHSSEIANDGRKLDVKGLLSGVGEYAREVADTADNGFPWQASIGAKGRLEFVGEGKTVSVNGRSFKGPLYVARKAVLHEVSFVALGADRGGASARMTAGDPLPPPGDAPAPTPTQGRVMDPKLEAYLAAAGFDPAAVTETQLVPLRAAFDASRATPIPRRRPPRSRPRRRRPSPPFPRSSRPPAPRTIPPPITARPSPRRSPAATGCGRSAPAPATRSTAPRGRPRTSRSSPRRSPTTGPPTPRIWPCCGPPARPLRPCTAAART